MPRHSSGRGVAQAAFSLEIDAAGLDVWRSAVITSSQPRISYPNAAPKLRPGTTYAWRVSTFDTAGQQSPFSSWTTFHVAASAANWTQAVTWLGDAHLNVYKTTFAAPTATKVKAVVLYICGLGFSSVALNGKVLNTLTTSPWTNNGEVNAFSSFDITTALHRTKEEEGGDSDHKNNELVVSLGNGWRDAIFTIRDPTDQPRNGAYPRMLRAMVVATLADGTQRTLAHTGDGTWQGAVGPSTYDSVYNGEHYDARIAQRLFSSSSLQPPASTTSDDGASSRAMWTSAPSAVGPAGAMVAWAAPGISVLATIAPVAISTPRPNLFVVDFGERRSGVVRLSDLSCTAGSTIVLRHAEILQHAGLPDLKSVDPAMIYIGELRSAAQTDVYTCSGAAGGETWAPQLTYHGFRYVEVNVSHAPGTAITTSTIAMLHVASDVKQTTKTHFSSATLNKIQRMALGAQRSNLMTIPTDCDQRDERLGWMGDANLSGESMALNFDLSAFFGWWVRYVAMPELGADGSLPDVSPYVRFGGRPGDPSWTSALPNVVYQMWRHTTDLALYQQSAAALAAHIGNLGSQAKAVGGLGKMHTPYGDWCPPPVKMGAGTGEKPSAPLTSAFSYIRTVQQVAQLASAVGDTSAAANYSVLAKQLVSEYNAAFATDGGMYDTGTQTALALSLAIGAAASPKATASHLLAAVSARQSHSFTGIIGSANLYDQLDKAGAHDVALAALSQTSYPSFGFAFANALEKATTNLWELPDAPVEGTGMNSRNHHMFSSYSAYLVRSVAGLAQADESVGYQHLNLRPSGAYALRSASVTMQLSHGDLTLEWERSGGVQFDKVAEGDVATLSCGRRGGLIASVAFASFGTPTHDGVGGASNDHDHGLRSNAACHAPRSAATVAASCVGHSSCTVAAQRDVFEMAEADIARCTADAAARAGPWAEPLRLWVAVQCERPDAIDVHTRVPPGSRATMRLPVRGMKSPVLREGGEKILVEEATTFRAAKDDGGATIRMRRTYDEQIGDAFVASFGSGEYAFVLAPEDV